MATSPSPGTRLDRDALRAAAAAGWAAALPTMEDYIRIPNQSPAFDAEWATNGLLEQATDLIADWCRAHAPPGMGVDVMHLEGRTPLIHMQLPGTTEGPPVLLYGHLDKQPPMLPWAEGLDPHEPVLRDGRLYGRGGADDGYAAFAAVMALSALVEQGVPRPTCHVIIEASEESGSPDLPAYMAALAPDMGAPGLVVALDSGCGDYEHLWLTTSLRGIVLGTLKVDVLREGVHSGDASGIVPSSFRIARQLLDRLEDAATGEIRPEWLHVPVPPARVAQAQQAAEVLGDALWERFPWVDGTRPADRDLADHILARTWKPALSVTGADGLPPTGHAGNVLRTSTTLALSLRVPPGLDTIAAEPRLKALLEVDPPHGATVTYTPTHPGTGWAAPELASWLEEALEAAGQAHFGGPMLQMGEGGTIPFMSMLGEQYPEAQFLITGVLGPQSNAHGPNEFLHLRTAERLTCVVAEVLEAAANPAR